MGGARAFTFVRLAAMTAVAALGAGSAAVAPLAAAAAVGVVPFATGHVLADGHMAQPPTTAECEADFGIACYQAYQIQKAYDLDPLLDRGITGRGETIVIVDAFGSPSIRSDLRAFDKAFGLPDPPSFQVITPEGPITTNPSNCTLTYTPGGPDLCSDYYGWTDETSLDVEWSHVMAPGANILLVETPMTETEGIYGFPQIVAAENYVIDHHLGQVISQSFGATEETFSSPHQIYSLRSAYINAEEHGVTVLGASGDYGSTDFYCDPSNGCANPTNATCCYATPVTSWPASDPLVTAVGGTQLHLDADGNRTAPDNVWNDSDISLGGTDQATCCASGGGLSTVFSRPDFQDEVARIVGNSRGVPDISMSAAVNGAVDFYDTTDPGVGGWGIVGGTSEASPLFSGVVALADQEAGHSLGYLNPELYNLGERGWNSGIVPIFKGNNTFSFYNASGTLVTVPGFSANGYYNDATGWGTVNAALFVPALAHRGGYGH
jgi:subtilase family serine protease